MNTQHASTPAQSASDQPTPPAVPGHTLIRRIGGGAYGEVWLGRDMAGAWRAVKIVRRTQFTSARPFDREVEGIERFTPVSRLHESQVAIHTVGRDDAAGWFFYTMELADDVTTGQAIDPAHYTPRTLLSELAAHRRLSAAECLRIGVALATALEHLHRHELIHRDIKPSNIIFVQGRPKLADIGLVATADETMTFVGTEGYVPPEGPRHRQGDLFSLGRVLYQAHYGRPAAEFPAQPTNGVSDDDPALSRELNLVILKAAANEPEDRHKDAAELRAELLLVQSGRSLQALRLLERNLAWLRRFGLAAALVAVAASVALVVVIQSNRRVRAERTAAQQHAAEARLAEARAVRVSGLAGRRAEALAAIAAAARVAPSRELRDEAIASMALIDFGDERTLRPHPMEAVSKVQGDPARVQFSPDFTRVAWCLGTDRILVADTVDWRELVMLTGREGSLLGLAWSPDGRFLAGAFHGETLVWRLGESEPVFAVKTPREPPTSAPPVSFSADGTRLASRSGDIARIIALPGGVEIARCQPLVEAVGCLLNPIQPWVAVWSNAELVVWNYAAGMEVNRYRLSTAVSRVEWSPHGRELAVGLYGRTILVADVTRSELKNGRTVLYGHTDRPVHLAFHPRGDLLISTARDGNTRLWDPLAGTCLASTYRGLGLAFSPDGGRVAFSRTQHLGEWKLAHGVPAYRTLKGRVRMRLMGSVDFSPDGRWLATAARDEDGLWLWDASDGRLVVEGVAPEAKRRWLHWLPDGRGILTLGADGLLRWPFQAFPTPGFSAPTRIELAEATGDGSKLELSGDATEAAALSADGRQFAVKAAKQSIWVADLARPREARVFRTPQTTIGSLALRPDGRMLAVGSGGGGPSVVLDLDTGDRQAAQLPPGDANVAFSADGRWLARFGEADCEIYDGSTFSLARTFVREHLDRRPGALAFSTDGRYFAYLRARGLVELLEADSLKSLATITLPNEAVATNLRFSADGDYLAVHESSELHLYYLPSVRRELKALGLDW